MEPDLFRETPLRLAGYANEVGESFKPLISRSGYFASYGIAGLYVLGDAYDKYERADNSSAAGAKALVWQALASVIIPGFVINRVVAVAGTVAFTNVVVKRYAPTLVGLASIPLIVKPIDAAVDSALETAEGALHIPRN